MFLAYPPNVRRGLLSLYFGEGTGRSLEAAESGNTIGRGRLCGAGARKAKSGEGLDGASIVHGLHHSWNLAAGRELPRPLLDRAIARA
jgi:hypothetical protein